MLRRMVRKTLLIDADLRMPAVAQSLGVHEEVEKRGGGLVGYFAGKVAWDEVVIHEVHPGLDVLGSTRRGRQSK